MLQAISYDLKGSYFIEKRWIFGINLRKTKKDNETRNSLILKPRFENKYESSLIDK